MKSFLMYVVWAAISGPLGLDHAGFNAINDNPVVYATPIRRELEAPENITVTKPLSGKHQLSGLLTAQDIVF